MATEKLPEQFGRYELVERIGLGGMAEVFRARYQPTPGFQKVLVLKRILPHLTADERFVKMFRDEAAITVHLTHNNIVQVFDFGEVRGQWFLAMEYVRGHNLRELLRQLQAQRRPMPQSVVAYIALEIARGLAYAHSACDQHGKPLHIVHRDLNPPNVLLSMQGEVKITDFGIARARRRLEKTDAGRVKGKVVYVPPEVLQGATPDHRADLWSLGCVIYEMLAGEPPYPRGAEDSDAQMVFKILSTQFTPIQERVPDLPTALQRGIEALLQRDPNQRPLSADEAAILISPLVEPGSRRTLQNLLGDVLPLPPVDPTPSLVPGSLGIDISEDHTNILPGGSDPGGTQPAPPPSGAAAGASPASPGPRMPSDSDWQAAEERVPDISGWDASTSERLSALDDAISESISDRSIDTIRAHPRPTEPPPKRFNPGATTVVVAGIIGIVLLVALAFALGRVIGDDDDETAVQTTESTASSTATATASPIASQVAHGGGDVTPTPVRPPVPKKMQMQVLTAPPGALVRINGREVGKAPVTVNVNQSSMVHLEVSMPGRRTYVDILRAPDSGESFEVKVPLDPLGRGQVVLVTSVPSVATAEEGRIRTTLSRIHQLPLPEGLQTIVLSNDPLGLRCEVRIDVTADQTVRKDVDLRSCRGD